MADMANILGLSSPSQISRYENGQNLPDICAISKIALALEVDLNWLITGEKRSLDESIRNDYIKSLSLLNTQLNRVITSTYELIEGFKKAAGDIEQKERNGTGLTDAEKENLKFYSAQIEFQKTILDQLLKDQAWASKAMNDALLNNYK